MEPLDLIDPEIRAGLAHVPDLVFSSETLAKMRQFGSFPPQTAPDIERIECTTGPSRDIGLTILRPRDAAGPLPVLYWMHGGGMVIGTRHMDEAHLMQWCRSMSCVCVSVDYRLAPEAPYPLPLDDCDAGLRYLIDHAAELDIDTDRIGVGGRSAGGCLAAGLALRWRDRGESGIAFQYLEYPMLDDRQATLSSQFDNLPMWSRESNEFGWRSYLGDRYGTDDVPSEAAPARATQLSGLPPTFIAVGTVDALRDEAVDYGTRLCHAGVPTELHLYAGAVHGFHLFADSAVVRCAVRDCSDWLARRMAPAALGTTGTPVRMLSFD